MRRTVILRMRMLMVSSEKNQKVEAHMKCAVETSAFDYARNLALWTIGNCLAVAGCFGWLLYHLPVRSRL